MNGRYVHVSSSWREEKERHIYSLESVCFYEKQTPLQYLHVLLWFFFLSSFCPVVKRVGLYWKAFIATRNILHILCLGGNKEKNKRSLVKSSTSKSNSGRPRPEGKQKQHVDLSEAHLSTRQTDSFHHLNCKHFVSWTFVCLKMIHFFKEGCLIGVNDTLPNKIMRSGKGCNTEENDKTKPVMRPNQTNVPFKNISHTEWLSIKGTSKQTPSDDLVMCRPQLQSRHHCSQTRWTTKKIYLRGYRYR